MEDETSIITKSETPKASPQTEQDDPPVTSHLLSISIRGWLALLAIFTVCIMNVIGKQVVEPLATLSIAIVGFYFGQNQRK